MIKYRMFRRFEHVQIHKTIVKEKENLMSKQDVIKLQGIVREVYPGSKFKVEIFNEQGQPTGNRVNATISGKLRMNIIKILKGDKVDIEVSVYDLYNGRIVWRYK